MKHASIHLDLYDPAVLATLEEHNTQHRESSITRPNTGSNPAAPTGRKGKMKTTFINVQEFYNDNHARRTSPEADYGSQWTTPDRQSYRVSYIQDTGEVYAVNLSGITEGPVHLLGLVPPDPVPDQSREHYYRTLDNILDG